MKRILRKWGMGKDLELDVRKKDSGFVKASFFRKGFPQETIAAVYGLSERMAVENLSESVKRWTKTESLEELELYLESLGKVCQNDTDMSITAKIEEKS